MTIVHSGLDSGCESRFFSFRENLFAGKTVFVCGGCSGVGRALAEGFFKLGAEVVATGVAAAEVARAAADVTFSNVRCVQLDVRDPEVIDETFRAIERLDVLVNCAGVIKRTAELSPDVFMDVVNVNLNGTMRVCAAARPVLTRDGGGCVINTASMLSFFGGGLVPGYSASKGGVAQLTKSLAIAYAVDNVRVNAIAPGWIQTPLTSELQQDADRSSAIVSRTPLGRWGVPEDIVGAGLFLASPSAQFVTGVVLPVDGGYLCV